MKGVCTVKQLCDILFTMQDDTMLHSDDIVISGNFNKGTDEEMGRIIFGEYPFERADLELNIGYDFGDI